MKRLTAPFPLYLVPSGYLNLPHYLTNCLSPQNYGSRCDLAAAVVNVRCPCRCQWFSQLHTASYHSGMLTSSVSERDDSVCVCVCVYLAMSGNWMQLVRNSDRVRNGQGECVLCNIPWSVSLSMCPMDQLRGEGEEVEVGWSRGEERATQALALCLRWLCS